MLRRDEAGDPRLRYLGIAALACCLGFIAFAYYQCLSAPIVGYYHDDGLYIVGAKSLISGQGYRIISLPSELPQTKYPFLYSAILAAFMAAFRQFPSNVLLFKLLSVIAGFAWAWVSYRLAVEAGYGKAVGRFVAAVLVMSPWTLFFGTTVMPDTLYALTCTCALLFLNRAVAGQGSTARNVAIAAAFCAMAFLLRTMAVALIGACILPLLFRRLFRPALLFCGVCAIVCAPWLIWQARNTVHVQGVESYYLNDSYSKDFLGDSYAHGPSGRHSALQRIEDVVTSNAITTTVSLRALVGLPVTSAIFVLAAGLACAILFGEAIAAGAGRDLIVLWALLHTLMLLVWIWPPTRYLGVALPIYLLTAYAGMRHLARRLTLPPVGRRVKQLLAACVICCCVVADCEGMSENAEQSKDWPELQTLFTWVRDNTRADAVIAANLDPLVYLYTGRKSIRLFKARPYVLFYGSPDPAREPLGSVADFEAHLMQHGIGYLLVTPMDRYSEGRFVTKLLRSAKQRHPDAYRVVARAGKPGYFIVSVDLAVLRRGQSI